MKRLLPTLILATPLALAGCNKQPVVEAHNASVAEVAEKTRDAVKMQAGEWSMVTELLDIDMLGAKNPQIAAMIKSRMAQTKSKPITYCFTKEEAERPLARMLAGDASSNCKYDHFTMADGKIDAAMQCGAAGPNDTQRHNKMTMAGTFTGSSIDMVTTAGGGSGDMQMNMKMHLVGKRVGECKPGEEKEG